MRLFRDARNGRFEYSERHSDAAGNAGPMVGGSENRPLQIRDKNTLPNGGVIR